MRLERKDWLAVGLIAVSYTAIFTIMSCLKHATFHSSIYDLGLFDQVIWNTAHGRFFESSVKGFNYLGDHFSPFLVLMAPLYWIREDVRLLLFVQTALVAASVFPFAAIACDALKNRVAAVVMAAVFLLYPNIGLVNMFDFHPEFLTIPLFVFAVYFMRKDRPWVAVIFSILAVSTKEEVAITAFFLGLYMIIWCRKRNAGLFLAAFSAAYFGSVMGVLMPMFKPAGAAGGYLYAERYVHLGGTMGEIAKNALLHPVSAVIASFSIMKLVMFFGIFAPTAFMAILGWPIILVALPVLGYSYLSAYDLQFDIRQQYITIVVPFIMVAAVDGMARLIRYVDKRRGSKGLPPNSRRVLIPVVSIMLFLGIGGLAANCAIHIKFNQFTKLSNQAELEEALSMIPRGASVATFNNLGPHLSQRRVLEFAVPFEPHLYHYAKFNLPLFSSADWQLFDLNETRWTGGKMGERIDALKRSGYRIALDKNNVILLTRTAP